MYSSLSDLRKLDFTNSSKASEFFFFFPLDTLSKENYPKEEVVKILSDFLDVNHQTITTRRKLKLSMSKCETVFN